MRGNKEDARERNPGIEISPSSAFFLFAQQGKQHRMGGFSFPNVQFLAIRCIVAAGQASGMPAVVGPELLLGQPSRV